MSSSLTIAIKEVKLLFKAKRRIILFFTVPLIVLFIAVLSIAIGGLMIVTQGNEGPIVITVVDHSHSNESLYIIYGLESYNFQIDNKSNVNDPYSLITSNNPPDILIYFPSDFSTLINNKTETAFMYLYYNNKQIKYETAISIIQGLTADLNSKIIVRDYGILNLDRIKIQSLGSKSGVSVTQASSLIIIPIYILMFFVIPPISLILISITQEREQKTLESLLLQPISRKSIVNGKLLYGLILVASNLLITLVTLLIVALSAIYLLNQFFHVNILPFITPYLTIENVLVATFIILGLTLVAILLISLAVMMSLLAKDEREGNLVVSILMILPVIALVLIIAVPYDIFGVTGEYFFSSLPVIGFMYSLYVTILTGTIGPISYVSLLAQAIFSLLSIWFSSKLIEIEGILDINMVQALKKLLRLG